MEVDAEGASSDPLAMTSMGNALQEVLRQFEDSDDDKPLTQLVIDGSKSSSSSSSSRSSNDSSSDKEKGGTQSSLTKVVMRSMTRP